MAGWVDGWMMGTRAPCLYLRWYLVTVCPMCALLALYCTFIWCMAAVQVLYASSAMSFLYYRIVLLCPTTIFRRAQSSRTAWLRVAGLTGNPLPLSLLVVSRSLSVYPSKKLQAVFSGFGPGLKLFFPGIRAHPSY